MARQMVKTYSLLSSHLHSNNIDSLEHHSQLFDLFPVRSNDSDVFRLARLFLVVEKKFNISAHLHYLFGVEPRGRVFFAQLASLNDKTLGFQSLEMKKKSDWTCTIPVEYETCT